MEAPKVDRVEVKALMSELGEVQAFNAEQDKIANHKNQARDELADSIENRSKAAGLVQDLESKLDDAQAELQKWTVDVADCEDVLASIPDPAPPKDDSLIKAKLEQADEINQKAAAWEASQKHKADLEALKDKKAMLSSTIEDLRTQRKELLAGAAFPVPGLGLEDGCVTFNGLPFDQASSAQQLRVSVAMGLAMNPKLKVLLIKDGSLLDANSLRMVAEMAAEADAQVWVERVSEGEECQVIIEDGEVRGVQAQTSPEPVEEPEPEPVRKPVAEEQPTGGLFAGGADA